MARETVFQREARECGDLDGEAPMGGIVAVDKWRDHYRYLGFVADFLLGLEDGQVDGSMWCIIWHRVDLLTFVVVVDLLGFILAEGVVVQNTCAGRVDVYRRLALAGAFLDAFTDRFSAGLVIRRCGVEDDIMLEGLRLDEIRVVQVADDSLRAGELDLCRVFGASYQARYVVIFPDEVVEDVPAYEARADDKDFPAGGGHDGS